MNEEVMKEIELEETEILDQAEAPIGVGGAVCGAGVCGMLCGVGCLGAVCIA